MAMIAARPGFLRCALWLGIFAAWATSPAKAAPDQWSQLNLQNVLGITALAVDPTTHQTIYVTTLGGQVHKSVNGGAQWTVADPGQSRPGDITPQLFAIAVHPLDPAKLLVGADFGRVYITTANGGWDRRRVEMAGSTQTINAVAFVPRAGDEAIAGTSNGVWTSRANDIGSWTVENSIPSGCRDILSVAVDPGNPDVRYAGSFCGLFKTTGGSSGQWTQIGLPALNHPVVTIAIDPVTSDNVYAGTLGHGVFKVQNGGLSATNITTNNGITNSDIRGLVVHRQFPNVIYAATGQGAFKGTTAWTGRWLAFSQGLPMTDIVALGASPNGDPRYLYAATASAVFGIEQSTVLPQPADLVLSARQPRKVAAGVYEYVIDVRNNGPNAITTIKINIEQGRSWGTRGALNPPLKDRIQGLSFRGGSCDAQRLSCGRGPLANGSSAVLSFTVKSTATRFQLAVDVIGYGGIANNIWGIPDPNAANNTAKIFLPGP